VKASHHADWLSHIREGTNRILARHSKKYIDKVIKHKTIQSPSRNMIIAGLIASTVFIGTAASSVNYSRNAKPVAAAETRSNTQRIDWFAESSASRGSARTSINEDENVTWGGIEQINIVQTKSDAQDDATAKLLDAVNAAQSTYDNSDGKADEAHREALKTEIDTANGIKDDATKTVDELTAQMNKVNTARKTVDDDVNDYNARIQAASDAQSRKQDASNNQAIQESYEKWLAAHPDTGMGDKLVAFMMQYVGKVPYVWAGSTPSGWDCSGFVMYSVKAVYGINLPHQSGLQMNYGTPVPASDIRPGDLVLSSGHAATYYGDGMVVNALNPSAGTTLTPIKWAFPNGYVVRRLG